MSDPRYLEALESAEMLAESSEEELYAELGLRLKDIYNISGYERSKRYEDDFEQDADDMLSTADLKAFGRRWWKKLAPELMSLVCDPKNEEMGTITGGKTIPEMAAALATATVISVLAPPAWIIVATSVLATKIISTGLDTMCKVWEESLEEDS